MSEENTKIVIRRGDNLIVMKKWPEMRAYSMNLSTQKWSPFLPGKYVFNLKTWSGDLLRSRLEYGKRKYNELKKRHRIYPLKIKTNRFLVDKQSKKAEFVKSIPRELVAEIKEFPDHHWHMLSTAARSDVDKYMQMIDSNPAIAYMMSVNWMFNANKHPQRKNRSLIRRKQHKIVKDMGFPGSRSVVRMLRRIKKENLNTGLLLKLRNLLLQNDIETIKYLRHAENISLPVIIILDDYSDRLTAEIINEIAELNSSSIYHIRRIMSDIIQMENLEDMDIPNMQLRFQTINEIHTYHDTLAVQSAGKIDGNKRITQFPESPLLPDNRIEHIKNGLMLEQYAKSFKNCSAMYFNVLKAGEKFLYVYNHDNTEVMILVSRKRDRWVLEQALRPGNKTAPEEDFEYIKKWIHRNNQ